MRLRRRESTRPHKPYTHARFLLSLYQVSVRERAGGGGRREPRHPSGLPKRFLGDRQPLGRSQDASRDLSKQSTQVQGFVRDLIWNVATACTRCDRGILQRISYTCLMAPSVEAAPKTALASKPLPGDCLGGPGGRQVSDMGKHVHLWPRLGPPPWPWDSWLGLLGRLYWEP